MTVLQVSKHYPPDIGGIEQTVATLAEGLSYDVSVLSVVKQGFGRCDRYNGVPVRRVGSLGTLWSLPIAPTFPIHLRRAAKGRQLIHYHLPNPLSVSSHLMTVSDEPVLVATYHSDIVRQAAAMRFYRPVLRKFLEKVDRILVSSPRLRDNAYGLKGFRDKCEVVPLGVNLDRYDGTVMDISLPTDDRSTVLFVGRLNYYKGVEYLIEAMQEVDARLLVVGDGERREDLQQQVKDLHLEGSVEFLGRVPEKTLKACYDSADVFVLPSVAESEAFGVVQLEAMAYETPIVNTDLPTGVPWVSQDGETGLTVPPRDSEALARALNRLLDDDELRARYGKNGCERVEAKFSQSRIIERVSRIYADLGVTPPL